MRHKNYRGKRLSLLFKDLDNSFKLIVDVGVYYPLLKKESIYNYEIAFGNIAPILINPIERMIAEKLSTFALYGIDNTRDKDLFDAYFLLTTYTFDKTLVKKMLIVDLIKRKVFYQNFNQIAEEIIKTLNDPAYNKFLKSSKRNWIKKDILDITREISNFLNGLTEL